MGAAGIKQNTSLLSVVMAAHTAVQAVLMSDGEKERGRESKRDRDTERL